MKDVGLTEFEFIDLYYLIATIDARRKSPVRSKLLKDQFDNEFTSDELHRKWCGTYEASRLYDHMKEIYALVFDGTLLTKGTGTIVSDPVAWCYKLTGKRKNMRSYADKTSDDLQPVYIGEPACT